jgi:hypothetical protein
MQQDQLAPAGTEKQALTAGFVHLGSYGSAASRRQRHDERVIFVLCADLLLAALHEGLRSATPAPLPLLAALAQAAAAVPPQLLRPAVTRLLPWLLEALRRLQVHL